MPSLDPANLATIITGVVGVIGMWGAHKISARATQKNTRAVAETDAYTRARALDLQTIERQNAEIKDLLEDNIYLRKRDRDQIGEIDRLRTERAALVRQNIQLLEQLRRKNQ